MEFSSIINFKTPIHHVIFSGRFFIGVDNETGLLYYDRKAEKLVARHPFKNPVPHRHYHATGSSINGELLVVYLYRLKGSYLLHYNTQKNKYIVIKELN